MQCVLNILTTINRITPVVKINTFMILPEKILRSGIVQTVTAPWIINATANHAMPHVGERGNHLCLAQKHTKNTSCILSTAIARPSYALQLSTHGVTGANGGKEKYPLNTSQKKSFTLRHNRRIFWSTLRRTPYNGMRSDSYPHQWGACRRPVISAGEEPGNHVPLLFRELHTAGNRGFIRAL